MGSAKHVGRIVGLLLIVQLSGLIVPFVMLHPITTADFLTNAAGSAAQIKAAILLLFVNCALTIGISVLIYPLFHAYKPAAALLLVVLSAIMFVLQAVDNSQLMAMLSVSQEYIRMNGAPADFETLSAVVRSSRRWAHYQELLVIDSWIFMFYVLLLRFSLVPRWLSVFGMLTVAIHFAAIPLPLLLGYGGVTPFGALMALSHIIVSLWLIIKGFNDTDLQGLN